MFHELKTTPFYKPNVLAMLNTLYPPCLKDLPNDLIEASKLQKHRAKFYNFIIEVEQHGVKALEEFEKLIRNSDCKHNWVDTRENLRDYIELASRMIEQSNAINDIDFFNKSGSVAYSLRPTHSRSETELESFNVAQKSSLNRKRLASPKRRHEYLEEYRTIPISLSSLVTTPALHQEQNSTSSHPTVSALEDQYRRPRANTPFMEKNSEAAQHESFQSWVPLKDQHPMSTFRQRSYPDPWSRGPPNPKYQLPKDKYTDQEKLLQALRQPVASIKRRASFSDETTSTSLRERASSVNSTNIKPYKMHKDSGATSFDTIQSISSPYFSQQILATNIDSRKKIEKAPRDNSDPPQADSALNLPRSPGHLSGLKSVALESTGNPNLRTETSYSSSGGLGGRGMSGASSMSGSPLIMQHDSPEQSAAGKVQLRKVPLREPSPDVPDSSRMRLRKKPLLDTSVTTLQTPSPVMTSPGSPLITGQESPLTPTPSSQLRKAVLHNSSIGVETRNASRSVSTSSVASPLNPTTQSPRMDFSQHGKNPSNTRATDDAYSSSSFIFTTKKSSLTTRDYVRETPVTKNTVPGLSPSADLSFLNSPYEPPEEIQPRLQKKSSMATIVRRKSSESLKSVRFEEPETNQDNVGSKTPRKGSGCSKTSKKPSVGSMSARSGGTLINESALGISIPGAQSSTTLFGGSGGGFFTTFPPPPEQATAPLKKQKSMGIFPRRGSDAPSTPVDAPLKPILKKQKSLGLFPRRESGKDKDKAKPKASTLTSKSQDMGGIFDGTQHACTAYYAHTATACREPYKFPVPPGRTPIVDSSVTKRKASTQPIKNPASLSSLPRIFSAAMLPISSPINTSILRSRPALNINHAQKSPSFMTASPISPGNKVYGFQPPLILGGWESNLDIVLEQEHREKVEQTQAKYPSMREKSYPNLSIDTTVSNRSHKPLSKLSESTSFANDTPNLPPFTAGSSKLGSFFMNAGANISAIFAGKSTENTPELTKPSTMPVLVSSRGDVKDRSKKSNDRKLVVRKERSGSKLHCPCILHSYTSLKTHTNLLSFTALTNFMSALNPSKILRSRRRSHKSSLLHNHKPVSYRKRELAIRRQLRLHANIVQRYRSVALLEDSAEMRWCEGVIWASKLRPFLREGVEEYRRREWLREWLLVGSKGEDRGRGARGMPFLREEQVVRGVRKGGRDTRRRVFEGIVRRVGRKGGERVLEKVDWRKEGWFERPRGKRKGEGALPKAEKFVMIATSRYERG